MLFSNGGVQVLGRSFSKSHKKRKLRNKKAGKGFGFRLSYPTDKATVTISARYYKDGSEVLISRGKNKNPRKLTERECARLQGFPDSFKIPVSTVQAYKQFGNSVPVNVVEAISSEMINYLELSNKKSKVA